MRRSLLAVSLVVLVAGVVVSFAAGGSQAAAEGRWAVRDLGTLGGNSAAAAVNEQGQVVGWSSVVRRGRLVRHAFVWEKGRMRDLGTFAGAGEATAVNDRGQVVGWSSVTRGAKIRRHAVLWENGKMRDLGTLGGSESVAEAINNRGQVAGEADTRARDGDDEWIFHAFLWEDGRLRDIGSLGGTDTWSNALNDRGQVVGVSKVGRFSHAFSWQNGGMRDLGALISPTPAHIASSARAVNERGQVVGRVDAKGRQLHAFLWGSGRMRDLGTLGGDTSEAWAINRVGHVVGRADTKRAMRSHAFLWAGGKMRDLGTLGGWRSEAVAINDHGQVAGNSETPATDEMGLVSEDGEMMGHAFVWQDGRMIDLAPPAGFEWSRAVAINDQGWIIGCAGRGDEYASYTTPNRKHAVLWTWQPAQ